MKKWRHLELLRRVGLSQGALEFLHQLGHHVEQVLVHEVQPPGQLLRHCGLFEAQLAGEPQEIDLGPQVFHQRSALAGGPAGRFQVDQPAVDPAMLFEHRDALGLGGVRRDDRAYPQVCDDDTHVVRGDPAGRSRGNHVGERAA